MITSAITKFISTNFL